MTDSSQGGWLPTKDDTPYDRLGGTEGVKALAEAFYDVMEATEPELTVIHALDTQGKVTREFRDRFAMFLIGWLGGPQDYIAHHGHPRLRMRHAKVKVDVAMRDAWLRAMYRAMDQRKVDGPLRAYLDMRFADVADFMRNQLEGS